MTTASFTDTLRGLLRRRPFQPFEVELSRGSRILVDRPEAVALNGGSAGFIAGDGSIHFFSNETTERINDGANGSLS